MPIHPLMTQSFPVGQLGFALLLIRLQVAAIAIQWVVQSGLADVWIRGAISILGACVFLGIFARIAAIALILVSVAAIWRGVLVPSAILQSFALAAVAFAGAGAVSMDSWIFGRQVIRFRP